MCERKTSPVNLPLKLATTTRLAAPWDWWMPVSTVVLLGCQASGAKGEVRYWLAQVPPDLQPLSREQKEDCKKPEGRMQHRRGKKSRAYWAVPNR